jgi:hypothetical protein
MTRGARTGLTALALVVLFCVAGCTGPSLAVPPGSTDIAMCAPRSTPYPVTDIGKHAKAPCDIAKQMIVFPNGFVVEAPEQGDNEGIGGQGIPAGQKAGVPIDNSYSLLNLGTYGIVAGELDHKTGKSLWWGTKAGLKLYWASFGKKVDKV